MLVIIAVLVGYAGGGFVGAALSGLAVAAALSIFSGDR